MASPTQWTWVWVNPGSWWWTGKPGVLQSLGSQRVGHDWVTKLNWTTSCSSLNWSILSINLLKQEFYTEPQSIVWPTCEIMGLSSVQLLSRVLLFETPWTVAGQAFLSITNSQGLLKLMSITLVMPSILCHPLLLPHSIFPSIRVFSNESVLCIRWPKYWSFSFSISSSSGYSGLISFRIDWLDVLVDQGTLKSLLQHHTSKASIR